VDINNFICIEMSNKKEDKKKGGKNKEKDK
jgi:hypothetical protein